MKMGRLANALHALGGEDRQPTKVATEVSLTEVLGVIGPLLVVTGSNSVNEVERALHTLARNYGRSDLRIVVLPTFVLIEDPQASPAHTSTFSTTGIVPLRLDQTSEMEHLIRRIALERPDLADVVVEVKRITSTRPRFGFWRSLLGHVLITVGFGLVINPTITALPIYAILGLIVGAIVLLGDRLHTLALVLPVLAAFIATALVGFAAADSLVQDNVLRLVAPALVSFLPGVLLTVAAIELANGQIIAGASRLVYGIARLAMLAFGVYLGIIVSGVSIDTASSTERLGPWAPWIGVLVVSVGFHLYSVAPKRSLPWVFLALIVAYAGQTLGSFVFGATLSGLLGALIVVPFVYLISHFAAAPPAPVMLICAYWILVPGSLGFIGLSQAAAGSASAGGTILQTVASVISISIGIVLGAGLSRNAGAVARAWRRDETIETSNSNGT